LRVRAYGASEGWAAMVGTGVSPLHPIGGTLPKSDPFATPSTSHWTGAAIIVQFPRTKTCIVTRSRTSTGPMLFSLAG